MFFRNNEIRRHTKDVGRRILKYVYVLVMCYSVMILRKSNQVLQKLNGLSWSFVLNRQGNLELLK
jgi:hypothetical protein